MVPRLYVYQEKVLGVFCTDWQLWCSLSLSFAHGSITTPMAFCVPVSQNALEYLKDGATSELAPVFNQLIWKQECEIKLLQNMQGEVPNSFSYFGNSFSMID